MEKKFVSKNRFDYYKCPKCGSIRVKKLKNPGECLNCKRIRRKNNPKFGK